MRRSGRSHKSSSRLQSPDDTPGHDDGAGAGSPVAESHPHGLASEHPSPSRGKLSRRACDACRARRRRCLFDINSSHGTTPSSHSSPRQPQPQVQCRECLRIGLVCSFLVPTRRRGRKRRTLLSTEIDSTECSIARTESEWPLPGSREERNRLDLFPSSPAGFDAEFHTPSETANHEVPQTRPSTLTADAQSDPWFETDEIAPRAIVRVIIEDYLMRIYPLLPVVHRPTFRRHVASNGDIDDPDFSALLISLVAVTVGLLTSRFPYYQSLAPHDAPFRRQTRMSIVNNCIEICSRMRTSTYWDNVSQQKWAVSYVLSVACVQLGQTNRSRMLEVEALQIGRLLGIHSIFEYEGLNCIETQLRKKAFWLAFYAFAHAWHQYGRQERLSFLDHSMLGELKFETLAPLEVDDEQILEDKILEHPPSLPPVTSPASASSEIGQVNIPTLSLTSGFNLNSLVFFKSLQIAATSGTCDWGRRVPPEERLAQLRQLLQEMQYMLDAVPGPLRQWASTRPGKDLFSDTRPFDELPTVVPPAGDDEQNSRHIHGDDGHVADVDIQVLPAQFEIMRANLHSTHLWLQSALLDKVDVILQELANKADSASEKEAHLAALKESWSKREDVCRQMLHLLYSMPYTYVEPNGLYLTYKVRDIGVALLNCPYEAHEAPAQRCVEYMRDFTRALSRLDRSEIMNTSSLRSWVDTDREKPFPG